MVGAGYHISDEPHTLTLANGPIRLHRRDGEDLLFMVSQQYKIVRWENRCAVCGSALHDEAGFRVKTFEYRYKVDDYRSGQEIIAYHWQPSQKVKYPHLHVSAGAGISRKELLEGHFPTGRVALEDVIQFLIELFEVPPARNNWAELLERGRQEFRKYSSWARFEAAPSAG
jgi:hypothetical protein